MAPPDVLEKLRAADWERIYPALVAYAVARTNRLPLVKGGGPLPQGHQPDGIAAEAVRQAFEGERRWDPERHPDLLRYLANAVSSLVSNLVTSADHVRRDGRDPSQATGLDGRDEGGALSQLDALASDECVEELRAIVDCETADDERLVAVQMGLEDGLPRDEIAEVLSIGVSEVYNLTRKLRRRILSAMAGHECWEDHPLMAATSTPGR